jgi:hypothetical protein
MTLVSHPRRQEFGLVTPRDSTGSPVLKISMALTVYRRRKGEGLRRTWCTRACIAFSPGYPHGVKVSPDLFRLVAIRWIAVDIIQQQISALRSALMMLADHVRQAKSAPLTGD